MSHDRNIELLNRRRIVYRRYPPATDIPTRIYEWGFYYEDGTYNCYELFRSKAKINSYKSLKWHLLVLWYLNPTLDPDDFADLAEVICIKSHGFITFSVPQQTLKSIIYDVSMQDLDDPPKNKLRKIIFKDYCGLTVEEKLRIVGSIIGRSKKIHEDDIYQCMLDLNDLGKKITISRLAKLLNCSTRTIHRAMGEELKREKEILNKEL
tara:strand:+ start:523 stop:1146 length:624 start_codon:yes stop_codon:yes gene_type:complete